MSKTVKFTEITKDDFEEWLWIKNGYLSEDAWGEIVGRYEKEVESFIDYLTETMLEDYKKKEGIFTPTAKEQ